MEEPTLERVIDGFRHLSLLGGIEERAASIASYSSQSLKVSVAVARVDGTVAHFVQSSMINDFDNFRMRGYMGELHRFETTRFEIDMAPQNIG